MDNYRNKTRKVQIGDVCIGGGEKIAIQSMTNTKTEDVEACVAQILRLEKAGCDIIRVAVPTMEAAESISKIKKQIHIPLSTLYPILRITSATSFTWSISSAFTFSDV